MRAAGQKRPNPFRISQPAKVTKACEHCAHPGQSHVRLTLDGLMQCKDCPGGDSQCHKMRGQASGREEIPQPERPMAPSLVRRAAKSSEAVRMMRVWIDGACNPNPGPSAYGLHAVVDDGRVIDAGGYLGEGTSNRAEHEALRAALTLAEDEEVTDVRVFADSQLVVRQALGEYAVNDAKLRAILDVSLVISDGFESFQIRHIPREGNMAADALSKEALVKRSGFRREFKVTPDAYA